MTLLLLITNHLLGFPNSYTSISVNIINVQKFLLRAKNIHQKLSEKVGLYPRISHKLDGISSVAVCIKRACQELYTPVNKIRCMWRICHGFEMGTAETKLIWLAVVEDRVRFLTFRVLNLSQI